MNRSLPIHLIPVGNVADRQPVIGNPKHEFLPANRDQIAAELRGMVERWKRAGMPVDETVRHPFGPWAKTVGGILKVNGFTDFLANYGVRKTADDPVRQGLGLLGTKNSCDWLPASEWLPIVVELGLVKTLIKPADQDSEAGRIRGIGVVLSAHQGETFIVENDKHKMTLRLERKRTHWGKMKEPQMRYRFVTVGQPEKLPVDEEPEGDVAKPQATGNEQNIVWEDI